MNKKTIGIGILIGILVIGVVSAGLLDFFGRITGSVEVKAPEFYLDGSQPIIGYLGLAINEKGTPHDPVDFIGPNPKFFISESLGVESFYEADWEIILSLRTENNVSGQVDIEIYTIEGVDPHLTKDNICTISPSITIPQLNDSNFHSYSITCEGNELIDMEESDMLVLRLSDGFNLIKYDVELNGNSKIEVYAT
ncbi:unnamed protein product [marine sediment metagenome]|uniref:Uncharacterized protein n=1 Tax=marine sediment metagenome TaxID=412755 RepID=X1MXG2_9ZZZZ